MTMIGMVRRSPWSVYRAAIRRGRRRSRKPRSSSDAASVFDGTAPYVAPWLRDAGNEAWCYWYVTVPIFLSLLVYTFIGDTGHPSRLDRD